MAALDLSRVIALAEKYYPKKKYNHAMRVAAYAFEAAQHDDRVNINDVYAVAIAHDLIEDTECPQEILQDALGYDLFSSVLILTKSDTMSYEDYIKEVVFSNDNIAILVKRADMKDHLAQVETLTDKLRDKYIPVLHYFL